MSSSVISRTSEVISIRYATQGGFPILYLMKDTFYYHFISIISCCGPYFSQGIHRISSFHRANAMQLIGISLWFQLSIIFAYSCGFRS